MFDNLQRVVEAEGGSAVPPRQTPGCARSRSSTSASRPRRLRRRRSDAAAPARPVARAEAGAPPADPLGYDAVITFGGAMHADQEDRPRLARDEKELLAASCSSAGVPLLGVCLGAQLLAEAAGGPARRASQPEIGWHAVELTAEGERRSAPRRRSPRASRPSSGTATSSRCRRAPALARSAVCLQAYRIGERAWGIQFHAEVSARRRQQWIDEYRPDADAVRIGVDPAALGPETAERVRPGTSSAGRSAGASSPRPRSGRAHGSERCPRR